MRDITTALYPVLDQTGHCPTYKVGCLNRNEMAGMDTRPTDFINEAMPPHRHDALVGPYPGEIYHHRCERLYQPRGG